MSIHPATVFSVLVVFHVSTRVSSSMGVNANICKYGGALCRGTEGFRACVETWLVCDPQCE